MHYINKNSYFLYDKHSNDDQTLTKRGTNQTISNHHCHQHVCVVLRKLAGNRVQSKSSFFFLLPIYSDVQNLAMTHSPFCAICWFCAPIVHISLLSVGRALAFFSVRFIYSARTQIKLAMITNLIIINEANRTPTQTNFTSCFLKDHLFSLLQEQPQSIHRREM